MKIIVGLGNPGPEYHETRHNFGYRLLDYWADKLGIRFKGSRFDAETCLYQSGTRKVLLVKPATFMNLSGVAVSKILRFYKKNPHDLLIAYDELDLPLGRMKLAREGSSAGHRGMESIIEALQTKDFCRLRLGIGKIPGREVVDYVLTGFSSKEKKIVETVLEQAVATVECFLDFGVEVAMNRYNRQSTLTPEN